MGVGGRDDPRHRDRQDAAAAGSRYLEHLTPHDLSLLGSSQESGPGPAELRSHPASVELALSDPRAYRAVFSGPRGEEPFLSASPFLVFALAVHRCWAELGDMTFVPEWLGPHQRVAVFDVEELRDLLAAGRRRLFLVELLASYTHVRSGSMVVHTRRGRRRRRFSELDPVRLAAWMEAVPEAERAGVYRRLGDLALFLTGVFPDHTETQGFGPLAEQRLRRSAWPDSRQPPSVPGGAVALLETLGRRWYGMARSSALVETQAMGVVADIGERFHHARRVLNLVTDRHLFPFRDQWMSPG